MTLRDSTRMLRAANNRLETRVCPTAVHEAMKASEAVWAALERRGIMQLGPHKLDLRNCHCGSTLAREVK